MPSRRQKPKSSKVVEVPFERLKCACGKWGYRSEPIANEVLAHIHQQPRRTQRRHGVPTRAYQCTMSEWWHLTSQAGK